jgi:hypothetical protein
VLSVARVPASRDERKSKHREELSFAMQLQGVLFRAFALKAVAAAMKLSR